MLFIFGVCVCWCVYVKLEISSMKPRSLEIETAKRSQSCDCLFIPIDKRGARFSVVCPPAISQKYPNTLRIINYKKISTQNNAYHHTLLLSIPQMHHLHHSHHHLPPLSFHPKRLLQLLSFLVLPRHPNVLSLSMWVHPQPDHRTYE